MILFGIPTNVQRFFAPVVRSVSRPIAAALPTMVLALLLAPHRRCLKTLAGIVLGCRSHASTISRRLRNLYWRTHDWYVDLYDRFVIQTYLWEGQHRRRGQSGLRCWMAVIDTTYHSTHAEQMENLLLTKRRQDPNRKNTRQHAFVMGILLTESGARIPLPRRSYYTQEYCQHHKRRYRTQVQLAAAMLGDICLPDDVELTVVFDSAFDANVIHQVCRQQEYRAVFPVDPNRTLSAGPEVEARGLVGQKVVGWTRTWAQEEFTRLELDYANEDHVFFRRRHRDNLRLPKTERRYVIAARQGAITNLGTCLIVASYKENPRVQLQSGQSADWWFYHCAPLRCRKARRPVPQPWHGKVLACTDATVTARQVVEWYEVRWQIELDLRSLKVTLAMDVLRCQSPEMVRKEVWAQLLAYNVIRNQMAQAAKEAGLYPVQLSFKGAVQGVNALAGWLGRATGAELAEACRQLRALLASYRIEERPNRSEPRARKRRPKQYPFLKKPRRQSGTRLAEKTCA